MSHVGNTTHTTLDEATNNFNTTTFGSAAPKVNTFYGHNVAVNTEMKEDWDAPCQLLGGRPCYKIWQLHAITVAPVRMVTSKLLAILDLSSAKLHSKISPP